MCASIGQQISDDYLLPLRSVLQVRHLKRFVRNETVFRDYLNVGASSEVNFEKKLTSVMLELPLRIL